MWAEQLRPIYNLVPPPQSPSRPTRNHYYSHVKNYYNVFLSYKIAHSCCVWTNDQNYYDICEQKRDDRSAWFCCLFVLLFFMLLLISNLNFHKLQSLTFSNSLFLIFTHFIQKKKLNFLYISPVYLLYIWLDISLDKICDKWIQIHKAPIVQ